MNTQQFLRPEKVRWSFPVIDSSWQNVIPSKSARKIARALPEILTANRLRLQWKVMTASDYSQWLSFYTRIMLEQAHDVLAQETWFEQKQTENKTVHLLECVHTETGALLGTAVSVQNTENEWSMAFKATERISIGTQSFASLGVLLDIEYLSFCVANSAACISAGTARNAFGFYNTLGYLLSKLRVGFIPTVAEPHYIEEYPCDPEKPTVWFVLEVATMQPVFLLSHDESQYPDEFFHFARLLELPTRREEL